MQWCHRHALPLIASGLCLALLPFFDQAALQRDAIAAGQWWRLLSGHLVHTNVNHLLLNLAGLWLITLVYPRQSSLTRETLIWLLLILLVSLLLLGGMPQLTWYVGLSGFLHGLLLWHAGCALISGERWQGLVIAGVLGKVGWELWQGASQSTVALINAPVLVEAHLAGVAAGLLLVLVRLIPGVGGRG